MGFPMGVCRHTEPLATPTLKTAVTDDYVLILKITTVRIEKCDQNKWHASHYIISFNFNTLEKGGVLR